MSKGVVLILVVIASVASAVVVGEKAYYRGWHVGFCTRVIDSGMSGKGCEDVKR